jgi:hypothetical protein
MPDKSAFRDTVVTVSPPRCRGYAPSQLRGGGYVVVRSAPPPIEGTYLPADTAGMASRTSSNAP